jgi:hypothetical protein
VSGCGSGSKSENDTTTTTASKADEAAARFAVRVQAELKQGRFAAAWHSLHPAERRVVSAQRLASCYPSGQFPGAVTFRAHNVADVRWTVPGTQDTTDAKAVSITATAPGQPKQSFEQHVVPIDGRWAWMLSSAYFAKAKSGSC